jgi:hypothetical protein
MKKPCLLGATPMLLRCRVHSPKVSRRDDREGRGERREARVAPPNVTRGKRRLKMRGSWRRWWPLGKPRKLSRGELEHWRPNTIPATEGNATC